LSSRLIAASVIQLIAVSLIFAANIYIFVVLIDQIFPDLSINYCASCFSNFNYDDCYFPFGGGYYTGIGICAGVTLQNDKCIELFEPPETNSSLVERTCETIDQAYQALEMLTPGHIKCTETFDLLRNHKNRHCSNFIFKL